MKFEYEEEDNNVIVEISFDTNKIDTSLVVDKNRGDMNMVGDKFQQAKQENESVIYKNVITEEDEDI